MTDDDGGAAAGQEPHPWPYVDSDAYGWPDSEEGDLPVNGEILKAKLEVRVKRTEAEIARAQALTEADIALEQSYYEAVLEVAKGSLDRARGSADTVQKAGGVIVTLYTGILALTFSVADNPLSEKALFATFLLGLSIVLSTAFLAYLPEADSAATRQVIGDETVPGERLTNAFVSWSRRAALARGSALRASIVALAGAVLLLPAPFVAIGKKEGPKTEVAWPRPDPVAGQTVQLQSIVYKAQVAEAVEQRKAPVAQEEDQSLWWAIFLATVIGALLTLAQPLLGGSDKRALTQP